MEGGLVCSVDGCRRPDRNAVEFRQDEVAFGGTRAVAVAASRWSLIRPTWLGWFATAGPSLALLEHSARRVKMMAAVGRTGTQWSSGRMKCIWWDLCCCRSCVPLVLDTAYPAALICSVEPSLALLEHSARRVKMMAVVGRTGTQWSSGRVRFPLVGFVLCRSCVPLVLDTAYLAGLVCSVGPSLALLEHSGWMVKVMAAVGRTGTQWSSGRMRLPLVGLVLLP